MPRNAALRPSAIVAYLIAILSSSVAVHAQSADGFDPGANQTVNTLAIQPDGKIIVGGGFTGLGGGTGTTTRNRIGRLNADGTVDPSFNPGTNGPVLAVAVQPDGKILLGGNFSAVGGGTGLTSLRSHIARLNSDGTVDLNFNPGANLNVWALAVQPDGKILVGGDFSKLGGGGTGTTTRIGLGRLNPDGSPDSFNPGASKLPSGAVPIIYTIALQPDGKVLVGGYFNGLGGGTGTATRNFIGRLEADGTLDTGFNPGASSISGINALALQADGRILVGGSFTGLGNGSGTTLRGNIGRLNSDGTVDTFNPGAEAQVLTLGLQTDGKILAGGYFKWLGDQGGGSRTTCNYIGRMNADGSVDGAFNPGAGNVVNAVTVQPDGAVVAAGIFLTVGGGSGLATSRNHVARLTNTNAAIQNLTLSAGDTVLTWARSGSGPEVSRVTFELSNGGVTYSLLGNATRVTGGWTLNGLSLPANGRITLRARGYYGSGYQNGSGSIAEATLVRGRTTDGDFDGDGKTDLTIFRPSSGTWYTLQSLNAAISAVAFGVSTDVPVSGDYDGDGRADIAVYRPNTGTWYISQSNSSTVTVVQFGLGGDVPVPGDYDGDTLIDIAVYRPSTGDWFIKQSGTNSIVTVNLGVDGDIPVAADFDGDKKSDVAVFRPSTGTWYIRQSTTNYSTTVNFQWGLTGDIPAPGDYDGDGKTDLAVFRPTTGAWYISQSASNYTTFVNYQWGLPGDLPTPGDFDGDGKSDVAVYRPSTGTWFVLQSSTGNASGVATQFGLPGDAPAPNSAIAYALSVVHEKQGGLASLTAYSDFDGDAKSDLTVYRPSTGTWFNLKSGLNLTTSVSTQWGLSGDVPTPGDFDGDAVTDLAVYRPNSGTWFILRSTTSTLETFQFGLSGDVPAAGDYDGDGKTDVAVFRPPTGVWYILKSSTGFTTSESLQWGLSGDVTVPGDYDGDGKTDVAVWRPSTGQWYIRYSGNSAFASVQWGLSSDITVPGDYDGDGKTDLAVWRPATAVWYILKSSSNFTTSVSYQWGLSADVPVPGDFDGDAKSDVAVWRPSTGSWYLLKSSTNFTGSQSFQWGLSGDIPILRRR